MESSDSIAHLSEQLKRILVSHGLVDEADSAVLNDYVQERENALISQRAEVASISERIAALSKKEKELRKLIARDEGDILVCQRRLGLSIVCLPVEILETVFDFAIPCALQLCHQHPLTYRNQPPFTLVQVCRRWRDVALSLPSLWTSFTIRNINGLPLKISQSPSFKEAVKAHYDRGHDLPKSVDLYIEPSKLSGDLGQDETDNLTKTASALFNNNIEIKYLSLGSPRLDVLLGTLGNPTKMNWWPTTTLSNVESLVLYSGSSTMPSARAEIFSRQRLKSLRRLTLCFGQYISPPRFMEAYYIPWKNLTHVAITSWIDYGRWSPFFPMLISLRHGLFYISDDLQVAPDVQPTTFSSLTHLTVIFDKQGRSSRTLSFDKHIYPIIRVLRLGAYDQPPSVEAFNILPIQPALSNLISLALHHTTWEASVANLVEILRATTALRVLQLGVSTNYDQLLQHFQVDWDGVALLPRLELFAIDCAPSGYGGKSIPQAAASALLVLTPDAFAGMVRDRWKPLPELGISQLRRARLFLRKGRGSERLLRSVKHLLKDEVKEGLALELGEKDRTFWVDPLERRVGHMHEGLILPEKSDCAECLRKYGE